jgi:hypothetical protein
VRLPSLSAGRLSDAAPSGPGADKAGRGGHPHAGTRRWCVPAIAASASFACRAARVYLCDKRAVDHVRALLPACAERAAVLDFSPMNGH